MTGKKNNILTRHLSSICGLSTASSKKDIASLDLIFHTSKKSSKGSCHFNFMNSFHKKINGINNIESLLQEKIHEGDILKVDYCDKFILNNSKEIE